MVKRIEEIEINPEPQALRSLHLSPDDFYQALGVALDNLEGTPPPQLPAPANIPIVVHGETRRLGELARIAVRFN